MEIRPVGDELFHGQTRS